MWMMVMLATMITYAGVVGDEHGDDDEEDDDGGVDGDKYSDDHDGCT